MTLFSYGPNTREHPQGTFWEKLEDGGVRMTKVNRSGQTLFSHSYTPDQWAEIAGVIDITYVTPPAPAEPEPVVAVDPAPRAPAPPRVEPDKTERAPRARKPVAPDS